MRVAADDDILAIFILNIINSIILAIILTINIPDSIPLRYDLYSGNPY